MYRVEVEAATEEIWRKRGTAPVVSTPQGSTAGRTKRTASEEILTYAA
jgi:hypothetical protein